MIIKTLNVVIFFLCGTISSASWGFAITVNPLDGAFIERPQSCSEQIGAGGNLYENGVRLKGKCLGGGHPPAIKGRTPASSYLSFVTYPRAVKGKILPSRDRSELALTDRFFDFYQQYYIGFNIRIPLNVDSTNNAFYVMQLWQCDLKSPIAGVRVTRGTSHNLNFITRGDSGRDTRVGSMSLSDGEWHNVVLGIYVDPRDGNGRMSVWTDGSPTPFQWSGSFGHRSKGSCAPDLFPPQQFRLKFGIYKANEPDRYHEIHFDNLRIGDTYKAVRP